MKFRRIVGESSGPSVNPQQVPPGARMNIRPVVLIFLILSSLLLFPIAPSYCADDPNRDLSLNTSPQPFNPPGPPIQGPSEFYRSWLIGIRAGLSNPVEYNSVYYYRAPGDLYADLGPYVSGSFLYGLARHLMVGLDIDYYSLPFSQDATGIGIGSSQTVSIIPEIEIRSGKAKERRGSEKSKQRDEYSFWHPEALVAG